MVRNPPEERERKKRAGSTRAHVKPTELYCYNLRLFYMYLYFNKKFQKRSPQALTLKNL